MEANLAKGEREFTGPIRGESKVIQIIAGKRKRG